MRVSHPFEQIAPGHIRYYLLPLLLLTVILLGCLPLILPLREIHTLLDLVAAGSTEAAGEILLHWSESDRIRVAYAVGFDFLLNPIYLNLIALGCIWGSRVFSAWGLSHGGVWLAWLAWTAIGTNVAENIALLRLLLGVVRVPWPQIATFAHYYAGAVIVIGSVYLTAAGVVRARGAV